MGKMNNCPDCGHEISVSAKSCPNCGKKNPNNHIGIGGALFLIIFVVFLIGLFNSNDSPSSSPYNSNSNSSYTPPDWSTYAHRTDLENKKQASVRSKTVPSDLPMDFPYNNTKSEMVIAKDEHSTWAYIEFTTPPNIVGDETKDGYNIIKANVYIDGVKETATLTQEWGSKILYFKYPNWLVKKLKSSNSFRINIRWHGNPEAVWSFSCKDFSATYQSMLDKYNSL